MGSTPDLIRSLRAKGITLSLYDGNIQYKGPMGALSDVDKCALSLHRSEVIKYLKAVQSAALRPPNLPSIEMEVTFSQEMWWDWATEGTFQPAHFTLPIIRPYTGLDYRSLQTAMLELVKQNNILRYRLRREPNGLSVELNSVASFEVEIEHLETRVDPNYASIRIHRIIKSFLGGGIPVESNWLTRAKIIVLSPVDAIAVLLVNHIISDAASCFILSRQLDNIVDKRSLDCGYPSLQFSDYAFWQRKHFGGPHGDTLISYWQGWLADTPLLKSPDRKTPLVWMSGRKIRGEFTLPISVLGKIQSIAKAESTSTFCVYFALFALAIANWSGQSSFAVRSTGDLRTSKALSSVVGNLICADPVRINISSVNDFSAIVHHIETEYRSAVETRLPTLQRFPPHCAKPGARSSQDSNTIGASINFRYRKTRRANKNTILERYKKESTWPPNVVLNIIEDWAVQIAPIWITLAETEIDIQVDLQFNSALITDREQRMFVHELLESIEHFVK